MRLSSMVAKYRSSGRGIHLAIALILLLLFAAPASAAPIISVVPSSSSVTMGGVFSVEFLIADVQDLYAFQFGIAFDPTILSANSVSEGAFLSTAGTTFFSPGSINNATGFIAFNFGVLTGAIAGASGAGALLTVSFTALAAGTSAISAVFDPSLGDGLFNSSLNEIAFSVANGSVSVVPPVSTVPEPSTLLSLAMGVATTTLVARRRQRRRCVGPGVAG